MCTVVRFQRKAQVCTITFGLAVCTKPTICEVCSEFKTWESTFDEKRERVNDEEESNLYCDWNECPLIQSGCWEVAPCKRQMLSNFFFVLD